MIVYLFSGLGADHRLFMNLNLNNQFNTIHIKYITPHPKTTLKNYANQLAKQIDTTKKFILIGVSIGGMICSELADILNPEKTIIISSAKSRNELPGRYRFMKYIPLHKLIPKNGFKLGAKIAQPLIEPDRNVGKEIFKAMLNDKDPVFLKRTINMIINWEKKDYSDEIIHIHGTKDHTIPINSIRTDYQIHGGSHMVVFTRGKELSELINSILNNSN